MANIHVLKMEPTPTRSRSMIDQHAKTITVSTPGRICLFGEHQDYLGLPVIAAAISLRLRIAGSHTSDRTAIVRMPDIRSEDVIPLTEELPYRHSRDYLRSSVNLLLRAGRTFSKGIAAEIRGDIPINSGTSSSSALVVTWIQFLSLLSDQRQEIPKQELAALAHQAEVLEFSEPGGMMDHYSTAIGGIIHLETGTPSAVEMLPSRLGSFVIGDSGEPKDTKKILARVKDGVLSLARAALSVDPTFALATVKAEDADRYAERLSDDEMSLLRATIENREITRGARTLLQSEEIDHAVLGKLLNRHQSFLREPLGISTPKIDTMIQSAYDAGALGAKINGSGGGGCMFAYAPDSAEAVRDALQTFGPAWIVDVGNGTQVEENAQ